MTFRQYRNPYPVKRGDRSAPDGALTVPASGWIVQDRRH